MTYIQSHIFKCPKGIETLTEIFVISLFTSVITRLIRNLPRLIPDKPGCRSLKVFRSGNGRKKNEVIG